MTREETIRRLTNLERKISIHTENDKRNFEALEFAISALEQEPCDDVISREDVLKEIIRFSTEEGASVECQQLYCDVNNMPPVTQKSGKCKNCKYFEYDSVAKVDGVPLIVAHEICNKWGDGCKTSEDGYCYLFEPQESEE